MTKRRPKLRSRQAYAITARINIFAFFRLLNEDKQNMKCYSVAHDNLMDCDDCYNDVLMHVVAQQNIQKIQQNQINQKENCFFLRYMAFTKYFYMLFNFLCSLHCNNSSSLHACPVFVRSYCSVVLSVPSSYKSPTISGHQHSKHVKHF